MVLSGSLEPGDRVVVSVERRDSPSMSYGGGHFRCRVSDEYGRAKPRRPDRGSLRSGRGFRRPEHTDVHRIGSRLMELLQDVAVLLLNVTLLGMGFVFLYRVWREIFALGNLQEGLEHHPRGDHDRALPALVHYLRYHRVSLNLLVEVGVSAIIQKMILVGGWISTPCSNW